MQRRSLPQELFDCYQADFHRLKRQFNNLQKLQEEKKNQALVEWQKKLALSIARKKQRADNLPTLEYPQQLPVSQKRETIVEAIKNNQVVIIAGETGSGKTTQLPKMCIEAGCGVNGFIGHTQPRRLAARSVCSRIAEELNTEVGDKVGFKVRFSDYVSDDTYIKLMTDGILLTEMQHDRFLNQYDTIIIDEAHERSLNIDFILGYLKQLLEKRRDLKVIITSATIDPERFSNHFANAPIIEVSGRTYPVEVRYQAVNEGNDAERDQLQAIFDAVDELMLEPSGDILIFMNGEREIRDTAEALEKRKLKHTEILPLYARLSASEQNRVFQSHTGRRIVLATNVAETSLTVPGIRYVIDPGTARISRYSYRTKVQRLPIEAISQASANQRKGRCGRVADGICIRLYDEDDFNGRPEFTDPEILRTNLASVILQMLALGLGDIEAFPFVQPPDSRSINDGVNLLLELGAVKKAHDKRQSKQAKRGRSSQYELTTIGKQIAKLPIDPRLARMLVAANDLSCLYETTVICTALSIQDPRERPVDYQNKADECHSRFNEVGSDFLSFLKLWDHLKEQQANLSGNQFRKMCRHEYLNYLRVREWQDLFHQVNQSLKELNFKLNDNPASGETVHKSLLPGLLSHIGNKNNEKGYLGARNSQFHIFPGSSLFKKQPKWVMASELVETSRLYARTNAAIDVSWVEPFAQHLVKKHYDEPHWEKKRQSVVALETQKLYGLPIVNKRRVQYGKIDPVISRDIFIREALINRQMTFQAEFIDKNNQLIDEVVLLEEKARRRDILVDEEDLFVFYAEKLPQDICDTVSFKAWWKKIKQTQPEFLTLTKDALMKHDAEHISSATHPDSWQQGNITLALDYVFEPGQEKDGLNIKIPLPLLNQVEDNGFDWSIPAYQHELITCLIKSLPKTIRRNFVPAPNYADACLQTISKHKDLSFIQAVSKELTRMSGIRIPEEAWDLSQVPNHLIPKFIVVDEFDKPIASGSSIAKLKVQLQGKVKKTLSQVAEKGIEQQGLTAWPDISLPLEYSNKRGNYQVKAYPGLHDDKSSVSVKLFDSQELAQDQHLKGLVRLICLNIPSPLSYLKEKLPNKAKLGLYFNPFGQVNDLIQDCVEAAVESHVHQQASQIRDEKSFNAIVDQLKADICDQVLVVAQQVEKVLTLSHQVAKQLKGKSSFELIQAQSDIKAQVDGLIFRGFVRFHGVDKLKDLQRYMDAIVKRLDKLKSDPVRDRLNRDVIQNSEDQSRVYLEQLFSPAPSPDGYRQLYYMLQELRVSLFAQNLGTNYPISAKRITNYIKELS
ncbi:ATP-dependent RNA helicase HrpA [Saccharobesus litoralis]|uniref:RNA helicase n=1 Tax=Saccharobesus litoralis TaxID=2172099 RepID=A0A2S0VU37_9ALTE|nr:ATP-dependent RNA helicase HrpA [Saccharobesus litoralis]AWB67728.1 ATP-dependent RNA helicase HrpA [Saccharobesus litoralis]